MPPHSHLCASHDQEVTVACFARGLGCMEAAAVPGGLGPAPERPIQAPPRLSRTPPRPGPPGLRPAPSGLRPTSGPAPAAAEGRAAPPRAQTQGPARLLGRAPAEHRPWGATRGRAAAGMATAAVAAAARGAGAKAVTALRDGCRTATRGRSRAGPARPLCTAPGTAPDMKRYLWERYREAKRSTEGEWGCGPRALWTCGAPLRRAGAPGPVPRGHPGSRHPRTREVRR